MRKTRHNILIPAFVALIGLGAGAAANGPEDDAEVTISLMPATKDDMPDAATNRIALPDLQSLVGNEMAQGKADKAEPRNERSGRSGDRRAPPDRPEHIAHPDNPGEH